MKNYLAPMEGLTGHVFRLTYHKHFKDFDRYFTPFIATNDRINFKTKKEIDTDLNYDLDLVPQLMTNKVEDTIILCKDLQKYGYSHININLGCPSGTVVSKKRGSGFLSVPEEMENFFGELFEQLDFKISIKTRIGVKSAEEWPRIVEVYKKFPFEEIIIHPRLKEDQYNGKPNIEAFEYAYKNLTVPLIYNGDIYSVSDYRKMAESFPDMKGIMIGRGILRNPFLIEEISDYISGEEIRSGRLEKEQKQRISAYIRDLEAYYGEEMPSEKALLYRMKETWLYLAYSFGEGAELQRIIKAIKKCQSMSDYHYMLLTLGI